MRFGEPMLAARKVPAARPTFMLSETGPRGVGMLENSPMARNIRRPQRAAQRVCAPSSCSGKYTRVASPANLSNVPPDQDRISIMAAK